MRCVLEYHDWAARTWQARAAAETEVRPQFKEGVRAYALRQSSIRKSMKAFCMKAWRSVPAYVCLSTETGVDSLASNDAIVPAMNAAPTLHSIPALVPTSSTATLAALLTVSSTDSLPELEATTATSTTSLPDLVSIASSSTSSLLEREPAATTLSQRAMSSFSMSSLPDLESMSNSSTTSLAADGRPMEEVMDEMARMLGIA